MPPPLAIVGALKEEISALKGLMKITQSYHQDRAHFFQGSLQDCPVIVGYTGIGVDSACIGLEMLIRLVTPKAVIGIGYAGGLIDTLETGHLVLAREICQEVAGGVSPDLLPDATLLEACRRALERDGSMQEGRLVTVNTARINPNQKREASHRFNAIAVDMESAAQAKLCQEKSLGFVALRAILDPVAATVPDPSAFLDKRHRISKRKVFSYVMHNPQGIWDLPKLASQAKKARNSLTAALPEVIREFS